MWWTRSSTDARLGSRCRQLLPDGLVGSDTAGQQLVQGFPPHLRSEKLLHGFCEQCVERYCHCLPCGAMKVDCGIAWPIDSYKLFLECDWLGSVYAGLPVVVMLMVKVNHDVMLLALVCEEDG